MNIISREVHDRIILNMSKPSTLIGSKLDNSSPTVFSGESADLRHDYWIIRLADPDKYKNADKRIDFSQPVGEGGKLLTDESFSNDLLTAKLTIIEALRGQYVSFSNANSLLQILWRFASIVRWRGALGVSRMQDLTPSLFDEFCERLKQGGITSLIPLESRIQRLEEKVRKGEWNWPTYTSSGQTLLDRQAVGKELGIGWQSIATFAPIRNRILSLVEETDPDICRLGMSGDPTEETPFEGLSVASVEKILIVWRTLHYLSAIGVLSHDPIVFDPFQNVSVRSRAIQISRVVGKEKDRTRTGTLAPEQWLALLDGAAKWVLDYADPIIAICNEAQEVVISLYSKSPTKEQRAAKNTRKRFRQIVQAIIDKHFPADKQGFPRLVPQFRRSHKSKVDLTAMTLEEALTHVVVACLVLIGGLSARRAGELESLQAGCAYLDPSGSQQWILSSYIEKTVRDNAEIPIPAMVAEAVKLLENLSKTARDRDETKWLTRIHRPGLTPGEIKHRKKVYLGTSPARFSLNNFAEIVGVRKAGEENAWNFKLHQLRRAFSIYYYHGNRYSTLDALSRFLRHYDPEATTRYITEATDGALMRLKEIVSARSDAVMDKDAAAKDTVRAEAEHALQSLSQVAKEHEEIRQSYFVDRATEIYDGDEAPIGQGAADLLCELKELEERAIRKISINSRSNCSPNEVREAFIKELRRVAPKRYVEPVAGRHAHCGCNPEVPSHSGDAVCLQIREKETGEPAIGRPDYAYASVKNCYECCHCLAFSENVAFVTRLIEKRQTAVAKYPGEDFRKAAKALLDAEIANLRSAKEAVRDKQEF